MSLLIALMLAGLPACGSEDSTNCYWLASLRGNGAGQSFIDVAGRHVTTGYSFPVAKEGPPWSP